MKSIPDWLITIIIFLIIVAGYWQYSEYKEEKSVKQSKYNYEHGMIKYELAGHNFDVPLKYYHTIYLKTGKWPTPKKDRVKVKHFQVDALLPDFKPYSQENAEKFIEAGERDILHISFSLWDNIPIEELLSGYRKVYDVKNLGLSKNFPGLLQIEIKSKKTKKIQNYLYLLPSEMRKNHFIITCQSGRQDESCHVTEKYKDIEISYYHNQRGLNNWQTIHNNVIKLLNSFEE